MGTMHCAKTQSMTEKIQTLFSDYLGCVVGNLEPAHIPLEPRRPYRHCVPWIQAARAEAGDTTSGTRIMQVS